MGALMFEVHVFRHSIVGADIDPCATIFHSGGNFMKIGVVGLSALVLMTATVVVHAQDDEAAIDEAASQDMNGATPEESEADPAATGQAESEQAAASSSETGAEGGRFRFGVAAGGGPLSADGLDLTYYGVDLRFGWQLSDAIGVYAQPQLGYYKLDGASALFGSGGLIGASVVADYTLMDRFFFGGGFGYGILNNPSGGEIHLRAGGYPLMGRSDDRPRRKGLMLGIDLRFHFVEGYTFVAPTFNVGYDAF